MASPTYDELYDQGKAEAVSRRPDLPVNPGDIADMFLSAATAMADRNTAHISEEIRKTFVETAEGDDLATLANDHFSIVRQDATAATVNVTFTRPSGGGGEPAGTIPAGTIVATEVNEAGEDVRFSTDSDVVWALSELGPKTVGATAEDAGRSGNVATGTISRIIDVIVFDSTFQVTNLEPAAGGNEEETDDELRDRIRNRPLTSRRATLASLEQGALEVPSVRVAKATEDGSGLVTVAVSDIDGNSNLQMISDVEAELENWRAAGASVTVIGGEIKLVNISVTLTLAAGASLTILGPLVEDAIAAQVERLKQGETLFDTMVTTAARNVDPDQILDVDYAGGDITAASNELIRPGIITVA